MIAGRRAFLKLAAAGVATLYLPRTALAQGATRRPLGVVELFTSQGCSSCPPADAYLADLARQGDVVALAYHVDYWDYLGWKDNLGSPENTRRQRDYAKTFGSVYTPQAVINGQRHATGSRRGAIGAMLETMADTVDGLTVDVAISESGERVIIDTGAAAGIAPDAHVILVYFQPKQTVAIARGENRGRTIDYYNAVTAFQTIGMWHGKAERFELPISEVANKGGACAVLLQAFDDRGRPGAILGAATMGPAP